MNQIICEKSTIPVPLKILDRWVANILQKAGIHAKHLQFILCTYNRHQEYLFGWFNYLRMEIAKVAV